MMPHPTEVKLASIMLGALAIGWSLVMLWPSGANQFGALATRNQAEQQ